MKPRYTTFNHKRRIANPAPPEEQREALASRIGYGGNAEHKRNPGAFGLAPPGGPRPGKSLCDVAGVFDRSKALDLLRQGVKRGLVSDRMDGEWPKNIWSMTADGVPLEAQLENAAIGTYHGYPMPEGDPMADTVRTRWAQP
jgi:hypothetical protein